MREEVIMVPLLYQEKVILIFLVNITLLVTSCSARRCPWYFLYIFEKENRF